MTETHRYLRDGFGSVVARTGRQRRRAVDRRLQRFGLSEAAWLPLIHLARAPAPMRQKDLAARAVCQGDGPVDHGRDDGADLRPDPGRLAHRQPQLALGVLHQRAVRHRHSDRPADLPAREPADRNGEARLDRLRCVEPGDRLVPDDDARPRGDAGLVQLARDRAAGLRRRPGVLRLPGAVLPGAAALPVAQTVRRPELHRRRPASTA